MKQAFKAPALGSHVQIVIDTSHIRNYLAADSKHRVETTMTLRGVVVASPKWFADHVTLINSDTRSMNHVPPHRILSINNQVVEQPKVTADVTVTVKASKGDGVYTVKQDGITKRWSCTCAGFVWKKNCRHITEVKAQHDVG
jgi:hypothetical protein